MVYLVNAGDHDLVDAVAVDIADGDVRRDHTCAGIRLIPLHAQLADVFRALLTLRHSHHRSRRSFRSIVGIIIGDFVCSGDDDEIVNTVAVDVAAFQRDGELVAQGVGLIKLFLHVCLVEQLVSLAGDGDVYRVAPVFAVVADLLEGIAAVAAEGRAVDDQRIAAVAVIVAGGDGKEVVGIHGRQLTDPAEPVLIQLVALDQGVGVRVDDVQICSAVFVSAGRIKAKDRHVIPLAASRGVKGNGFCETQPLEPL